MLNYCLHFILIILSTTMAISKPFMIKGQINGTENRMVYWGEIYLGKVNVLDSTRTDSSGTFRFSSVEPPNDGFYRIWMQDMQIPIDLLLEKGESVDFVTDIYATMDSLKITGSTSAKAYADLARLENLSTMKERVLTQAYELYKDDESRKEFSKMIAREIETQRKERRTFLSNILETNPTSLLAAFITASGLPVRENSQKHYKDKNEFLWYHYFDNIDLSDSRLMRSFLLPMKFSMYFQIARGSSEDKLRQGVEYILRETEINPEIHTFALEYLINMFEKTDYDELFFYLSNLYETSDCCHNEQLVMDIEEMKKIRRQLAVGSVAPNLTATDSLGKTLTLHGISAKATLLFFYASWCGHCQEAMPKLKTLYETYHDQGFEIFAFGVEEDENTWVNYVQQNHLDWVNVSDLKGWQSEYLKTFNVRGTPTFYLLDENKKILAKVNTADELMEWAATLFPVETAANESTLSP